MKAYQLESLTEKLKEEKLLHGAEMCSACLNGDHDAPGTGEAPVWCECPCHEALPPAGSGEISV